jgi:S-DNA-T family DNA segregation ATPase FtsK/SpoIIIE
MSDSLNLLVSRPGGPPEELSVSFAAHHRIGDLSAALADFTGERRDLRLALADGQLLDPAAGIAGSSVRQGDHLLLIEDGEVPAAPPAVALELRVVSGAAAGLRLPLPRGRYTLGRSVERDLAIPDPSISRSPTWVLVDEQGAVIEHMEARQELRVHGEAVALPFRLPQDQVFQIGGALLMVARAPAAQRANGQGGSIALAPHVRSDSAQPALSLPLPATPAALNGVPLPARLQERRRQGSAARYREQVQHVLAQRLPGLLAQEEAARRAGAPDAPDVLDRARLSLPTLWERRRSDPDFLRLRLGWSDRPSEVQLTPPAGADEELVRQTLAALLPARPSLYDVPLTVELARVGHLAIAGEPAETAGLLRWLVLQAACLHAPGELGIAALLPDREAWSWLAWLPHTAPDGAGSARRWVAAGADPHRLVAELSTIVEERRARAGSGQAADRALLLIVDDRCEGVDVLLERVLDAPGAGVYLLQIGSRAAESAPVVAQLVAGRNQLHLSTAVEGLRDVAVPDRVSASLADQAARALAGIEEPSPLVLRRDEAVGLGRILGLTDGPAAAEQLVESWRADSRQLEAVIGLEGSPVEVDLAAGPHALVTGTVEAGRSQLLSAWAAALAFRHSPRWLNLVPIGSPAFEDLLLLPHTAELPGTAPEDEIGGLVERLADEAERRRTLLDSRGEPEMRRLIRSSPDDAPANLVAIIDGYDQLVRLRPQIERPLTRLAETGQALGIHLILGATVAAEALPAGIRGNVGLRIDLDLQNLAGATISSANPLDAGPARGVAGISLADLPYRLVQFADVGHIPTGAGGVVRVQRAAFTGGDGEPGGATDLGLLIRTAKAASAALEIPIESAVWRPGLAVETAAPVARREPRRALVEMRLTVEHDPQPARDVVVELDPDRTMAELLRALTDELGLKTDPDVEMHLPRRQAQLRPDQSVRSARLRSGDRLILVPHDPAAEETRSSAAAAEADVRLDEAGRIAFNRPPRPQPQPLDLRVQLPAVPERGQGSWRSLLPVGTGVVMGLMMGGGMYFATGSGRSPGFLLLSVAMTPLMALLTGIMPLSDLLKRRRTFRQASAAFRERLKGLDEEVARAQETEVVSLHEAAAAPDALVERARTLDTHLWERRPTSADWLQLRIGLMETASSVAVVLADGGEAKLRGEAQREMGKRQPLPPVPMLVSLTETAPIGLYGDRRRVSSLARWMVLQLAVLHSPEDLVIAAAVPAGERQQWSWLSWLPHVHGWAGRLAGSRLVPGGVPARGLLQRLLALMEDRRRLAESPLAQPADAALQSVAVLLHEDAGLPRGQVARLLAQGHRYGIFVIWIASHREDLPGECRAEIGLHLSGGSSFPEMLLVESNRSVRGTTADRISVDQALEAARALAPVRDLSAAGAQAAIPEHDDLLELLGAPVDLEAEIREHWARRRSASEGQLEAPIGAVAGGAEVGLDLRVDGPHTLVEGPAGSGKSELLRTLVASFAFTHPPAAVSFLLIDHEGQGTFRDCAGLPHTATVVTYLDASGAKRVLSALQTELNLREGLLRESGARDLAALEQIQPELTPPSLVIVFDEFARLAADLPELMDGVLDLAQQGSRLGIHLVLATRQPASVTRAIRDSVNLQLSLRVVSTDEGQPAVTPRSDAPPGRMFARLGGEAPREAQVAFTGGRTRIDRRRAQIVVRELEFDGTPVPSRIRADASVTDGDIDLVRIARAIQALSAEPETPPAPKLLQELSEEGSAARAISTSVPLADLLGIADIGALDVDALWQLRPLAERLRVPVGLTSLGHPLLMDLKEAAVGGAGPHGLVIGTSGSGKSEMLRTLVTALAIAHPPDVLAFVFIDFKGGAAFAGLSELPHVAGMITNLQDDLSLIDRMQAAITGERNRRQERLRRAGNVDKLSEYQRKREQGEDLEPLPYLLLVVDEFGELLTARPDFVNLFAMIGRVGRSLGMHLLFSSQQFEEGRLRGLEDNLGYRVALRTASAMASRTVLGVPDAFDLPKEPGWGYYKFGPTDMVRFRAALVSQPYGSPPPDKAKDAPTMVDVAVEQLRHRAEPVHQMWLAPLVVGITLDRILGPISPTPDRGLAASGWAGSGQLRVPVGLVDKPAEQKQDLMTVDLSGHLLVVGASQTGKSTLLRTLLASAALTHTPREAQFYCIDYSGGALRTVADLPHVGGVTGRDDPERVRRTVEEVAALVPRRERLFQELGMDSPLVMRAKRAAGELPEEMADVFLVIDNWLGLRQEFEELEEVIRDVVAARGPGYGIHLVLTASRWMEVRDALRNAIGGRAELRLTDPAESLIDTRAAKTLSEAGKQYEKRVEEQRQLNGITPRFEQLYGRGITTGGLNFQAALPRIDGKADLLDLHDGFEALVTAVGQALTGPKAPPIRVLPRSIAVAQLPTVSPEPDGVPIAISEQDLDTIYLDLVGEDPHLIAFGDVESGKTTLLRTFLTGLLERATPGQAQILLVDYKRSLLGLVPPAYLLAHDTSEAAAREDLAAVAGSLGRRLPGPDVPAEQLYSRDWWKNQAEVYIVVDDYDLVASSAGSPLQPLYPLLPQSRDLAFHLVIARSSGGVLTGLNEAVLRRLRELRAPMLLLSGEPQEGALPGGYRMVPLPPGRGRLIRRREGAVFVQVAMADA